MYAIKNTTGSAKDLKRALKHYATISRKASKKYDPRRHTFEEVFRQANPSMADIRKYFDVLGTSDDKNMSDKEARRKFLIMGMDTRGFASKESLEKIIESNKTRQKPDIK